MSESKRTPWFPADVKPVRDGEYEVRRMVWNFSRCGFYWSTHRLEFRDGHWHYTRRARMSYPGSLAGMEPLSDQWRGLTRPAT